MRISIRRQLAGGLATALVAYGLGGTALAQTPAPAAAGTPSTAAQRQEAFLDAVASRLGKSPADVRAAIVAAEHDQVAQAVQAGRLTQDQASRINQRIDQSAGLGMMGHAGHQHGTRDAVAQFLGMQPADLAQQLRTGKSLAAVAQEHGKSRDDLKTFLSNRATTRLHDAVASGRLSQQQADAIAAKMPARIDQVIDHVPTARQPGQGGPPATSPGTPGAATQVSPDP